MGGAPSSHQLYYTRRYVVPSYPFSRFLNVRTATSPTLAPDGSRVAFLYDITGVPQVWSVPLAGGWPEQLTFFTERVQTVSYAPGGDRLLFGMDAGGDERQALFELAPDGTRCEPLASDPSVIHSWGAWNPSGTEIAFASNARDQRYFDIYIQPLDGPARLLLQHDGTNGVAGWSPDGRALLISRANSNLDNDLFLLDIASATLTLLTPHEGEARFQSPHFAGNEELLLVSNRDREYLTPARINTRTQELAWLGDEPWDTEELAASADGGVIAYTVNEDGYGRLTLLVHDRVVPVTGLPRGVLVGLDLAKDGATLVVGVDSATAGVNIWAVETATGAARQVTHASLAGIASESLASPELIRYPTFDGLEIPAFLYRPPAASGPLPVVVSVHGGPESQARPRYNATVQFLVHRGFAVLATNVRGSTGYGKRYTHLDDVRQRMDSVADLAAAVDWLKKSGTARPDAIAVLGGSYGGFMVLAALTTYPDLWAAGVNSFGIANFVTLLENTGPWRRKLREAEYGSLERDRDFLASISPIEHVDNIVAPLLVLHGARDPRVPIGESEQIVESLRERGRPVEYVRFEDEGHGFVKLPNRLVAAEATAAFLERYLGSKG